MPLGKNESVLFNDSLRGRQNELREGSAGFGAKLHRAFSALPGPFPRLDDGSVHRLLMARLFDNASGFQCTSNMTL